uniref:F-box domain-containing protein n=1 Tax=Panagrolaimus davidi TaxID=227884 RepID=A0A914Q4P0_9BILA
MITFNTDGMVNQSFAFKAPIMDYIFKNVKPEHLIKLYQCSKYFYAKVHLNIIQHLEIVHSGQPEAFGLTKTAIRTSNHSFSKLSGYWIFGSLKTHALLKTINISNFYRCTIKKLELAEYIPWKEFVMLTKAGTVEDLKILGLNYLNQSLEDIIAQVPNATSIEITDPYFSSTTLESLLSMNHKTKFTTFILTYIQENFDGDLLLDYILLVVFQMNADVDCDVHVSSRLPPPHFDVDLYYEIQDIQYNEKIAEALKRKKQYFLK